MVCGAMGGQRAGRADRVPGRCRLGRISNPSHALAGGDVAWRHCLTGRFCFTLFVPDASLCAVIEPLVLGAVTPPAADRSSPAARPLNAGPGGTTKDTKNTKKCGAGCAFVLFSLCSLCPLWLISSSSHRVDDLLGGEDQLGGQPGVDVGVDVVAALVALGPDVVDERLQLVDPGRRV